MDYKVSEANGDETWYKLVGQNVVSKRVRLHISFSVQHPPVRSRYVGLPYKPDTSKSFITHASLNFASVSVVKIIDLLLLYFPFGIQIR